MDLTLAGVQLLNGLSLGVVYLLVASGLSLIFGVTGIANFAHGGFYMLGAYAAVTVTGLTGNVWVAFVLAPLVVGGFALALERTTLAGNYDQDPHVHVLLTYGLLLCLNGLVKVLWGRTPQRFDAPDALSGAIPLAGDYSFPEYRLFVLVVGALLAVAVWATIRYTSFGLVVRAGTRNTDALELLGVDTTRYFGVLFALGSALAAVAGVLVAPFVTVYPHMGNDVITKVFIVVVLGGIGSFRGSAFAALLVGVVEVFGRTLVPELTGFFLSLLMLAVLLVRPTGLLGEYDVRPGEAKVVLGETIDPRSLADRRVLAAVAALALLPLGVGVVFTSYHLGLVVLALVWALFALSLDLVVGYLGVLSFGHAAFFGGGAYVTAFVTLHASNSILLAVAVAVVVCGALGWLLGVASRRLDGIYFAIGTLAFAVAVHQASFVFPGLTGGSDGIGVPVVRLLGVELLDTTRVYYLALAVVVATYGALVRVLGSPFGYTLRGIRESEDRMQAFGCETAVVKRRTFALSGAIAGVAGVLFATYQLYVSPTTLHWTTSAIVLVVALLGGLGTLYGPMIGAAGFIGVREVLSSYVLDWELLLGAGVVVVVLAAPRGAATLVERLLDGPENDSTAPDDPGAGPAGEPPPGEVTDR